MEDPARPLPRGPRAGSARGPNRHARGPKRPRVVQTGVRFTTRVVCLKACLIGFWYFFLLKSAVFFTGRQKTAASVAPAVTGCLSFMLSSTTPGSPGLLRLDGWEGSSPSSPPSRRPRMESAFCFGPSAAADRPPLCRVGANPLLGSAVNAVDHTSSTRTVFLCFY